MATQYWGAGRIGTHQNVAYTGTAPERSPTPSRRACRRCASAPPRPATSQWRLAHGHHVRHHAGGLDGVFHCRGGREGVSHPSSRRAARCTSPVGLTNGVRAAGATGAGFGHPRGRAAVLPRLPGGLPAVGETAGFAADFTHPVDAQRVAVRQPGRLSLRTIVLHQPHESSGL
jgi:hypothetical protein